MKILMLGLINPEKNDAGKIHFLELGYSLSKNGHQVTCILPLGRIDKRFTDNLYIIFLPLKYKERYLYLFLLNMLQFYYTVRTLKDTYDFIYIRFRMLPCSMLRLFYRKIRPLPFIMAEHAGWIEREMKIEGSKGFSTLIGKHLQMRDAQSADFVVAMTEGTRDMHISNGLSANKIAVVQNGTNIDHFYPLNIEERVVLRERLLSIHQDSIVFGFIGNISKWQGIEELLEAYLFLCKKYPLYLLIIGTGKYLKEIEKKVLESNNSDRIIIKKNVSYTEMNLWINCMDVAFAPKVKQLDGFTSPLKIRDYSASGKPVISTNIIGIKEFEKYGWLQTYEFGNRVDLTDKMERLLLNPNRILEMGNLARTYAEENFSWDRVAARITELYLQNNPN